MKMLFATMMGLLLWASGLAQAPEFTVTITVTGVENTSGDIVLSLYNKSDGFPEKIKNAIKAQKIPVGSKSYMATFKVPVGIYAISILHDEDRNGDMNKNFLGIPTEGYCFTNNATGFMSPPSFADASFVVKANVAQTVKMIY